MNGQYRINALWGLGALSVVLFMITRLWMVLNPEASSLIITSGFEEESLYALWKMQHHQAVYQDPHQIPFAASYFNWLFYGLYGSWVKGWMSILALPDSLIPLVARSLSVLIIALGGIVSYRLFAQKTTRSLAFGLAVLLWGGPLIGYWGMTVRPDVLGLFFDLLAAYCVIGVRAKNPLLKQALLAAAACYLSWSVKQINITMPMAIGFYWLLSKQYRVLFVFSGVLVSLYALTLLVAPDAMIKMLLFKDTAIPLSLTIFKSNFQNFLIKTLPVWLLAMTIALSRVDKKNAFVQFALCGLVAWMLLLLPASSKVGSAENYHFLALFFICLYCAGGYSLQSRWSKAGQAGAGVLMLALVAGAIHQGNLVGISQQRQQHQALAECLNQLPRPTFCIDSLGALPWFNQSEPSFVLAYNYWSDRAKGRSFEANGIGGLIEQGFFRSLVLPGETEQSFDGGSLNQYQRQSLPCMGYAVYALRE